MNTLPNSAILPKLIHIAVIQPHRYLYLRQKDPHTFVWYDGEKETTVSGITIAEAIQKARKWWKEDSFRTLNCGFRYTLPERDEHGCNALFYQMAASYSAPNGIYFDEDLGHNCIVNAASQEALGLWREMKQQTAPSMALS